METIIGLAIFGIVIMLALFLGQMLISLFFGLIMLIGTTIYGAVTGIIKVFKGE